MRSGRLGVLVAAVLALAACAAPSTPEANRVASVVPAVADAPAVPACPLDASPMDGWNDRAPPRRIFGNTYYVGTCGIAALLVVGDAGAVLIDGATERATGAPVLARAPAVATLRTGKPGHDDPQFGELASFPAVADVRTLAEGDAVRVGNLVLQSHATPGHAPGGTSWTWRSCEGARCLDLAYIDSHSALTDGHYRFADHPGYVAAFERSIDTVAGLPCDVLLTPHPAASNLLARLRGDAPLADPGACKAFSANARANLAARLADERKEPSR